MQVSEFTGQFGGRLSIFKLFFLPLATLKKPTERTLTSIKAKQWYSLRGYLAAETTARASVICTETCSKKEYTWSQHRRMSIFVHVYSIHLSVLNAYEGSSDSKSLRAGRLDINMYRQNLHLLYYILSSSFGELCGEACVNTGIYPRKNILGFRLALNGFTKTFKVKLWMYH